MSGALEVRVAGVMASSSCISGWTAVFLLLGAAVGAEPQEKERLIDQKPFDRITLNVASGGSLLLTAPLELPERTVPAKPKAGAKLQVRLLSEPGKLFDVAWVNIAKVELFEQMVLAEAEQFAAQRRFGDAFENYDFLLQHYPNTPRLKESLQSYLYQNAGTLFADKQYGHALAVLEELFSVNPDFRHDGGQTLVDSLAAVADSLIGQYVDRQDYASARGLIARLIGKYGEAAMAVVAQHRDRLIELAANLREEARAHLKADRLREAYEASRRMLQIWPAIEGGQTLTAEIAQRYPIVIVGVSQGAQDADPTRLDNWPVRRTGRLRRRLLVELLGPGPEGGHYVCPLGTVATSDDRRQLTFRLTQSAGTGVASKATGYDVLRAVVESANPNSQRYSAAWGQLLKEARVADVFQVELDLRRSSVVPEALLPIALDEALGQPNAEAGPYAPYAIASRSATVTRFVANDRYCLAVPGRPAEVVERVFSTSQQAIAALRRGDIDVVDRLYPADAAGLIKDSSLQVKPYGAPTVHMLVPNPQDPFLASPTFRRALAYGIDRAGILKTVLLQGRELPGCRIISGPFPAGQFTNDPSAYGYDERIEPRGYDPELAFLLARLARQEVKAVAEKRGQKAPQLDALVLGHPAAELARTACQAIARQLQGIQIKCRLKQLPAGLARDPDGECTLVYVEAAIWEPAIDAHRLLGSDGLGLGGGAYVEAALRQADEAASWKEVREALQNLHRIVSAEVPVIPLWQTVDYFAYQPRLEGVGERPVQLYQTIEQWRLAPPAP